MKFKDLSCFLFGRMDSSDIKVPLSGLVSDEVRSAREPIVTGMTFYWALVALYVGLLVGGSFYLLGRVL